MNLLTIPEAAKMTRMSLSWWRQQIFKKNIEHLKIGSRVLVPYEAVEDLIKRSVVESKAGRP